MGGGDNGACQAISRTLWLCIRVCVLTWYPRFLTAGCEDDVTVPDYKTQKTEIHAALQQRFKAGDTW